MDREQGRDSPRAAPDSDSPSPQFQRRLEAIQDALRALLRDHSLQQFGSGVHGDRSLSLKLDFSTDPRENWAVRFEPPLFEQVQAQLADSAAEQGRFVPGRVYCFRCGSSECEHSLPPNSLSVFRSYSSTGVPDWCELVQSLVDGGDERADQLYRKPPAVLASVQFGRALKREQLPFFGRASKTYSVLGQVVAGYFRVGRLPRLQGDRLAVTIQAVETRNREGRPCVRLNPVAGDLSAEEWEEFLVEDRLAFLRRGLAEARAAAEAMERLVQGAWERGQGAEMRKAFGRLPQLLGKLARAVEQGARQKLRRTHHAETRGSRGRPVHKALQEARAAQPEHLFVDEKKGTWIACGKQGRAHVFNEAGRHVTSFLLPPDGAAFRVRTSRWRPMQEDEQSRFKAAVSGTPEASPTDGSTVENPGA